MNENPKKLETQKEDTIKAPCQHCGAQVDFRPVVFGGVQLNQPICDACLARLEREAREAENKARIKRLERILDATIPPLYRRTDIDRLPCDKATLDKVLSWRPNAERGLALYGRSGRGKTRLLCLLVERLIREGFRVVVFWSGDLERAVSGAWDSRGGYDALFKRAVEAEILVLDDFGKDKITERYESFLFSVFEKRLANMRPTVFTTNTEGGRLADKFPTAETREPFIRRLKEFMVAIKI